MWLGSAVRAVGLTTPAIPSASLSSAPTQTRTKALKDFLGPRDVDKANSGGPTLEEARGILEALCGLLGVEVDFTKDPPQ